MRRAGRYFDFITGTHWSCRFFYFSPQERKGGIIAKVYVLLKKPAK